MKLPLNYKKANGRIDHNGLRLAKTDKTNHLRYPECRILQAYSKQKIANNSKDPGTFAPHAPQQQLGPPISVTCRHSTHVMS